MPIKTKRWDEPTEPDDGHRILITRYRPRGLAKADETWNEWMPHLGPSAELLGAFKGKTATNVPWSTYRTLYRREMLTQQRDRIADLATRVAAGETITLLCSSSCLRESRCHRSLLRELIEEALPPRPTP